MDIKISTVTTTLGEQEIESTGLSWTNVDMSFYTDTDFQTEIVSDDVHNIGDSVNIMVSWEVGDSVPDFPVSFYIKECSVSDESRSFNVIEDSCPSPLVNAQNFDDRITSSELKVSWDSFSFTEDSGEHNQSVECVVAFCITDECEIAECN